ncbi:tfIIIC (nucleomorph) [Hemiselmis andersenii]|uniref:TfIIIC n=1 Tax=Hemiselmis andersenii TaxID=464988 RepID=A9BLB2_HEMAN|nr:tfIIIC [Hemiselmis andersenii]ABW98295.1 tfIIIC [Hemiselmis andersenii]
MLLKGNYPKNLPFSKFSKKILYEKFQIIKKLISDNPKNFYFLKITGLINEYFENYLVAIKIYRMLMEYELFIEKNSCRLNYILFWHSIINNQSQKFSKNLLKSNNVNMEPFFFHLKFSTLSGNFIDFSPLFKKVFNFPKILEKKKFKLKFLNFFYFHLLNLIFRTYFRKKSLKYKIDIKTKNFSKLDFRNFFLPKILFLTFNNLIQSKKIFLKNRKILNLFKKDSKFEERKIPLIFEYFKRRISTSRKFHLFSKKKTLLHLFVTHLKWFSSTVIFFSIKKSNIHNFFLSLFCLKNFKKIFESYNSIYRNFHQKINFLLKISKIQLNNSLISNFLSLQKYIFNKNPGNFEFLNILSLIKKRNSIKKKAFKIFIKGLKIFIKKKFIKKNQNFPKKNIIHNLFKNAEIYFEKKKIFALSNLVLSLMLLKNQKIYNFLKKEDYKKKNLINFYKNFSIKNYFNQLYFFKNSQDLGGKKNALNNGSSSFKKLQNLVFIFILNNKFFRKERSLDFLIGNKVFFAHIPENLKICCILIAIGRKKFEKAYKISRIQCLLNPFCYKSWSLLTKLENHRGILTSKTLRYSLRVLLKYPTSIPAIIFTGNHCSVFGSFGYSLAEFFQAYRWKKDSPFLNFSIFLQYLNGSLSRKITNFQFAIFLSLSFFSEYRKLRHFLTQNKFQRNIFGLEIEMEILYNASRLYLFLGIGFLALKTFQKALKKPFGYFTLTKKRRFKKINSIYLLKKEILFNICVLFSNFGNEMLIEKFCDFL